MHSKTHYSINLKQSHFIGGYTLNPKAIPPIQREIMACDAQGGIWGELKPKQFGCNLKFKDANKACTDANQCQGKICFSQLEFGNAARLSASMRPKPTGFCPTDTYQAHNKRPGAINGEYRTGKLILYPREAP